MDDQENDYCQINDEGYTDPSNNNCSEPELCIKKAFLSPFK